jgi:hypothetical protein
VKRRATDKPQKGAARAPRSEKKILFNLAKSQEIRTMTLPFGNIIDGHPMINMNPNPIVRIRRLLLD